MTTFVGKQTSFIEAIYALIELDYDAAEAYEAAIERLDSPLYKEKIMQFKDDHLHHVRELSILLEQIQEAAPKGPSLGKHFITKGKVVLADLIGDTAILKALSSNEVDTNTAYERILERVRTQNPSDMHKWDSSIWQTLCNALQRGREDERRHKAWLDSEPLDTKPSYSNIAQENVGVPKESVS